MWDDEVDVVCCGSGFGALAAAVVAADAGLDVRIVRPESANTGSVAPELGAPWLGAGIDDPETREYLDALSADLPPAADAEYDTAVTVRPVSDWTPVSGRGRIAPFYGARLQDWARHCLTSPYGVLYTRLADRGTTSMKTRAGEEIQVKLLGSVDVERGSEAASVVGDWLSAQIFDKQIDDDTGVLQRLVFEEGEVLGAVIDTADGPLALRVRHGVALSTDPRGGVAVAASDPLIEPGKPLQLALVGYSASRFGRVELLDHQPADAGRSAYCRSGGMHDPAREPGRSRARRG
ncbi:MULTISPECIES: FAD-binding protein [Mycolicibacterium]|uniref:Pyruvate/2-oxoglutarate dehydrogenase complex, dihydrolipoamide dehydrogenase component n=1 Tax=Mycolicibacterium senegalense TaxID=1796 RepID=A0A378WDI9_9MYCO|nr:MULTISPECIES: FAD-binding protein [Mycolicibacterium]MCV7336483.1 FAD-binding protein [Mycolicibacterium senegalense]MDR7291365.1 hypothetical protein [Mycolicibacterium senegalense]QZA22861.1 FAD-binding protein [Mycolicibacterium senegalense]CDP84075.1 pyruvate/2-oxoglutarate dehydrogenase complex, dihydrolipoamide dehydrogenase component [Mycolicibacterium farcinogenes]SUA32318.1 pyruvate/2-oxoglutarate dehydrogenase complex, dihydrolipoamide dehydrogenase component [Mycolicibacterium se